MAKVLPFTPVVLQDKAAFEQWQKEQEGKQVVKSEISAHVALQLAIEEAERAVSVMRALALRRDTDAARETDQTTQILLQGYASGYRTAARIMEGPLQQLREAQRKVSLVLEH